MSDIQDLIYTTTMDCLERGRREEQKRIMTLWEQEMACKCEQPMWHFRELIKGETVNG